MASWTLVKNGFTVCLSWIKPRMQCYRRGSDNCRGVPVLLPWFTVETRTSLGSDTRAHTAGEVGGGFCVRFPFSHSPCLRWTASALEVFVLYPLCPNTKALFEKPSWCLGKLRNCLLLSSNPGSLTFGDKFPNLPGPWVLYSKNGESLLHLVVHKVRWDSVCD